MEERIKLLRKTLGLTQEHFGERLGITNTAVSKLEKGQNHVSEQNVLSICREFNVNEEWLRSGKGEIFKEFPAEDEYFRAAAEISNDNDLMAMNAVIAYWKLDKSNRELLKKFLLSIVGNIENDERS